MNVEKDEAARLVSGNRGVDRMAGIFGTPIGRGTGGFDPVARGANWFFWIAGLSLVNSVLWLLGTNTFMVMGLASSMVATGFFLGIGRGLAGTGSAISIALGVLGALLISSIFAGLGLAARKRMGWAFIVGMVLYGLDGVLMVIIGDYISAIFHGLALGMILTGYMALRKSTAAVPGVVAAPVVAGAAPAVSPMAPPVPALIGDPLAAAAASTSMLQAAPRQATAPPAYDIQPPSL